MKEVLDFLNELKHHNNHDWFEAHRGWYDTILKEWKRFSMELVNEVGLFDPMIAPLQPRDCSYRIYRDVHLSHDPTPFKTHFDIFLAPGGKRSMRAGYYFSIGTDGESASGIGRLTSGTCYYDPKTMKLLREDISYGWEEFSQEVLAKAHTGFRIDQEMALKRLPSGYSPDDPYAEWMKVRRFALTMEVDHHFVSQPQLAHRLALLFKTTKPFIDYVNRAVTYDPNS